MFNKPTAAQLASIPGLYQTDGIPLKQKWTLPDKSLGVEIKCPNCMLVILSGSEDDVSCPECKAVILQHRINSVDQGGLQHGIHS